LCIQYTAIRTQQQQHTARQNFRNGVLFSL
jgi:hypothetical protein